MRKSIPPYYLKKVGILLPLLLLSFCFSTVKADSYQPQHSKVNVKEILGRWDMTIDMDGTNRPSWLEIQYSGVNTLVGRFVGIVGSARPISEVHFEDGKISFTIPPQWYKKKGDLHVKGTFINPLYSSAE